jgi:hypothetical protein
MKNKKEIKIGVLLYTYDRVDDVRINMEIIRNVWKKSKMFQDVKIVHCYNGEKKRYPEKYLENDLVGLKNSGHFQGAAELIDAGIKVFNSKYKDLDYVFVLAADTWNVKVDYLEKIINKLIKKKLYLAACPWGTPKRNSFFDAGMSTDYFIFDWQWAKKYKTFPIDYVDFYKKFGDLFLYLKGANVMVEKLVFARFLKATFREFNNNNKLGLLASNKILRLTDREPVHFNEKWDRNFYWPKMGLLTHHEPAPKKKILKTLNISGGKYLNKLLNSGNLNYYNKIQCVYNM